MFCFIVRKIFLMLLVVALVVGCNLFSKKETLEQEVDNKKDIDEMLLELCQSYKEKITKKKYRVALSNIVDNETQIPSKFSNYLATRISLAISRCGFLKEYPREHLNAILNEQNRTISDIFDPEEAPGIGLLKAVDGIILGSYSCHKDTIEIYLKLLNIETGENLGTVCGEINRQSVPEGIELHSKNFSLAKKTLKVFSFAAPPSKSFKIQVWVDKGKGAIYRIGDSLRIKCKASKDCYLKLYHISADKNVMLIYPKLDEHNTKIKAEKIYEIPYEFEVAKPVGTEIIKAVASTKPFKYIEEPFKVLGKVEKTGKVLQNIKKRGFVGRGLKQKTIEDACIYTIVN